MLFSILTFIVVFLIVSLFGYFVHRFLHQSWSGKWGKKHMKHHIFLYPPKDLTSDKYRDAGADNTVIIFSILSIPLVAIPIILWLCGIMHWALMITVLIEMIGFGLLHDYFHDAFHITNHSLNRWYLFRKWKALHFKHHRNMKANFGIYTFFLDKLLGTYSDAN